MVIFLCSARIQRGFVQNLLHVFPFSFPDKVKMLCIRYLNSNHHHHHNDISPVVLPADNYN